MKTISEYNETDRQYYAELAETARLTQLEVAMRDACLSLYEGFSKWLATTTHTQEQAKSLMNAIETQANLPTEHFELTTEANDVSNQDIHEDNQNNHLEFVNQDEDDNEDQIQLLESYIEWVAENFGMEVSELPEFYFSLATWWGCILPYQRLYEYVLFRKQELAEQLAKVGLTPETLEKLKSLSTLQEDAETVRERLAELSIEIGDEEEEFDKLADFYSNVKDLLKAVEDNGKVDDNNVLPNDLTDKTQRLLHSTSEWTNKLLLDIVKFKMGDDILSDKLSKKEQEAFDSILDQPFINAFLKY